MMRSRFPLWLACVSLVVLGGCATRPVNLPIEKVDLDTG
jgi:hypothetical protein